MKQLILILIALHTLLGTIFAQQLPSFALYRDNWNILNPASISSDYIFSENNLSVFGSFRGQWLGEKVQDGGEPKIGIANFEWIMDDFLGTFAGASVIIDQSGKIGSNGLYGRFGYRFEVDRRGNNFVNVALSAGVVQYRADIAEITFPAGLPISNQTKIFPDFGLGVMYYHDDLFYVGVSVPQTFGLNTRFQENNGEISIKRVQHFYLMGGGYFDVTWLGSSASYLELSGFMKYVHNTPITFDINARLQISNVIWAGIGGANSQYFNSQTVRIEAGVVLGESVNIYSGQYRIGVAYGINLSPLVSPFGNNLELNFAYSWASGR